MFVGLSTTEAKGDDSTGEILEAACLDVCSRKLVAPVVATACTTVLADAMAWTDRGLQCAFYNVLLALLSQESPTNASVLQAITAFITHRLQKAKKEGSLQGNPRGLLLWSSWLLALAAQYQLPRDKQCRRSHWRSAPRARDGADNAGLKLMAKALPAVATAQAALVERLAYSTLIAVEDHARQHIERSGGGPAVVGGVLSALGVVDDSSKGSSLENIDHAKGAVPHRTAVDRVLPLAELEKQLGIAACRVCVECCTSPHVCSAQHLCARPWWSCTVGFPPHSQVLRTSYSKTLPSTTGVYL